MEKPTPNAEKIYNRYEKNLKRYNISYEDTKEVIDYHFGNYGINYFGPDGGIFIDYDFYKYNDRLKNIGKTVYFFYGREDNKLYISRMVPSREGCGEENCKEYKDGYEVFMFGSDYVPNLVCERVYVSDNNLFIERFYDIEKSDKVFELEVFGCSKFSTIKRKISDFCGVEPEEYKKSRINGEPEEFRYELKKKSIEPDAVLTISMGKTNNLFEVDTKYNNWYVGNTMDCDLEDLHTRDDVIIDSNKSIYEQAMNTADEYYKNFIYHNLNSKGSIKMI